MRNMSRYLVGIFLILMCVAADAAGQQPPAAPAAPVPPKPLATVESYEKTLLELMAKETDDWLWERTDPLSRTTLLQRTETVVAVLQSLPAGTVPPKPPTPAANRPNNPVNMAVTKPQWDALLKTVQTELRRVAK